MDFIFPSEEDDEPTGCTTSEHFSVFRSEVSYWISKFGLFDWCVYFAHDKYDGIAWRSYDNLEDRVVTIGLSTEWPDLSPDDRMVSKCAFHEVCELLLLRIEYYANLDACPSDSLDAREEVHSIIRRLEHALWMPDYKNRFPTIYSSTLDEEGGWHVVQR